MTIVFISQPTENIDIDDIEYMHNRLVSTARSLFDDANLSYVNYNEESNTDVKHTDLDRLAYNLQLMSESDVALFGIGWENDKQCTIIHECAKLYNIPIIYYSDLFKN